MFMKRSFRHTRKGELELRIRPAVRLIVIAITALSCWLIGRRVHAPHPQSIAEQPLDQQVSLPLATTPRRLWKLPLRAQSDELTWPISTSTATGTTEVITNLVVGDNFLPSLTVLRARYGKFENHPDREAELIRFRDWLRGSVGPKKR